MTVLSRRSVLTGAAAIPFWVWFERLSVAQTPLTRFEATSAQGQAMLALYARAVATMMSTAESSPSSWLFQWYTHAVRRDRTKAAEITRVFPSPGPARALADDMWSTCQAHFVAANEPFFLPWHRMYVFFFERIVRKVSGDPSFTLPTSDDSTTDPARHGVIPREFRLPTDAAFKSLFRGDRNKPSPANPQVPNVNNGDPIDKFAPGALSLAALKQGTYLPAPPAIPGVNQALDFGLHGNVHVTVGNPQNMGDVPWAARDPIFWLHHCNIDRLWASWNRNGGMNPTGAWLGQTFVFADENGARVVARVDDFKDLTPLGYTYDRFEAPPKTFQPLDRTSTPAPGTVIMRAPVTLARGPARAALEPASPATSGMTERVKALTNTRRLYLVLKDLRVEAAPGVAYNVYLDLPSAADATGARAHLAGSINFFHAAPHEGHAPPASGEDGRFFSFDVTEVAKALLGQGRLAEKPSVTIAPIGTPAADAKAIIGEVALVER